MKAPRRLTVLGATGSVGRSVLSVVEANEDAFEVVGLSANRNTALLSEQAERFGARRVAVGDPAVDADFPSGVEVGSGPDALVELATDPEADLVVNALVGSSGLPVTMAAVNAGKRLAIANKESLVMAGDIITSVASETGSELIPMDSEHSSIFRCLRGVPRPELERIVLTASGGPLRDMDEAERRDADVASVLAHPNWDMGDKVTVDSATLVNKAMEVVEARWLFDTPVERIDVVLHRESIVHALVRLVDGSMIAHLGPPDMRVPIQYALFYPEPPGASFGEMRAPDLGALNFEPVVPELYPCFGLVLESATSGGTAAAIAATADEVAVEAFLAGDIGFGDITTVIRGTLAAVKSGPADGIEDVLGAEGEARSAAVKIVREMTGGRSGARSA